MRKKDFGLKGRVLVAEDNPVGRRALEALLTRLGLVVAVAPDGKEALKELSATQCDLAFLDLHMPVMNGIEVTEKIRSGEKGSLKHLSVIAMSGDNGLDLQEKCRVAGMDDYLAKPFNLETLLGVLRKWLPVEDDAVSDPGPADKEKQTD